MRRVPLGAVRQVPGPQGGEGRGGKGGRQEAALVSSLSSVPNGDGGARPTPSHLVPIGAIIRRILANQKTSSYTTDGC